MFKLCVFYLLCQKLGSSYSLCLFLWLSVLIVIGRFYRMSSFNLWPSVTSCLMSVNVRRKQTFLCLLILWAHLGKIFFNSFIHFIIFIHFSKLRCLFNFRILYHVMMSSLISRTFWGLGLSHRLFRTPLKPATWWTDIVDMISEYWSKW